MKKLITILCVLCLFTPTLTLHAQDFIPVHILVPKFLTPKGKSVDVGAKVASTLGLQMWRTYSTRTRNKKAFDNAVFTFDMERRPRNSEDAEALANKRKKDAQLVLWGKASQYGDGIVVEANLLLRKGMGNNKLGTNIWSVEIPIGKKSHTVSVDVPGWQYEFAPIILDRNLIANFEADTRAFLRLSSNYFIPRDHLSIGIYSARSIASEVMGFFSEENITAIKHDGDWTFVNVEGRGTGWLYLPDLSRKPSEVVNFSSGIIRILRNDLPGAINLFQEVLKNNNSPTAIKIDSYLYMAIAYDKMHDQAKSFSMIAEAYKLNPYSKTTTRYLCMSYLSKLAGLLAQKNAEGTETKKTIESLQEVLAKNKILFAEDDSLIRQVEQVLADLTR